MRPGVATITGGDDNEDWNRLRKSFGLVDVVTLATGRGAFDFDSRLVITVRT